MTRRSFFPCGALLLCLLFLALPLQARRVTIRLSEMGIRPNQADDRNLTSRLDSALRLIKQQLAPGDRVVLRLERGTYHLFSDQGRPHELYISNHDQNQPKRVGIYLSNWHDLTIEGNGAELRCHGRMLPLALIGSSRCHIKDLSIDFADPQIAQVQVVKNSPEAGITFEVAPWVNYRLGADSSLVTRGEGWELRPQAGMAFERDTKRIVYRTADLSINTRGLHDLGGRQFLAPHWRDARLVPGTVVCLRTYERPAPGIFLADNTDTRLSRVKVHYAEGMGLLAQRCTNITLQRFGVCLRGDDDPRYFTTQADATHFSQCRGLILSRGGLYENMMDDAINVHGIYLRVAERLDDHTLRCTFGHNQAWGFAWGEAGDTVSFVRAATMDELPHTNVIVSIRPDGQDSLAGCKGFVIMLRDALPDSLQGGNRYGIENLSWTPAIKFARNIVRNNRARGALFSSPRRTICEDNLFDHTSGTAILLCGDCNGWFESGAVRDLVIRRNTFVNALTSLYQFTNAVISIYPEVPQLAAQQRYFHGGRAGAIRIEHNSFSTFDTPLLFARSVCGLVFRKNLVRHNTDYQPFHPNHEVIKLEHCTLTDIEQ